MLNYFYKNDLITLTEEEPETWEAAIQISCQNLMAKKMIDQRYVEEIIASVKEFGPYIVIVPEVAMPHASGESEGVFGTAISFTKFKQEIVFDVGNPEKNARLFFTLAAKNSEEHMENIVKLSELLMTDGLIEALLSIETMQDYVKVMETFAE